MGWFSKAMENNNDQKPENVIKRLLQTKYPDFKVLKEFWSCDKSSVMIIDETNTKIATGVKLSIQEMAELSKKLPKENRPPLSELSWDLRVNDYKEIISSEIVEDGSSVTKVSRSSQIASAAVGGALLGDVGVIVGGLSGKQENINMVSKIEVNIILNSLERPSFTLILLKLPTPIKKNSMLYNEPHKKAMEINGLMKVLIKRADEETPQSATAVFSDPDIPAQIKKLADLKADGILSEEEFEKKKAELLARM